MENANPTTNTTNNPLKLSPTNMARLNAIGTAFPYVLGGLFALFVPIKNRTLQIVAIIGSGLGLGLLRDGLKDVFSSSKKEMVIVNSDGPVSEDLCPPIPLVPIQLQNLNSESPKSADPAPQPLPPVTMEQKETATEKPKSAPRSNSSDDFDSSDSCCSSSNENVPTPQR